MPGVRNAPPGLTSERVGFFTDAVFAIAMTLLVIEIPRPEGDKFDVADNGAAAHEMLSFFREGTGSFVAYVLAFYTLWNVWRQHHRLFDQIDRLSPGMVRWHFPLLLLIGFLPYPTTVFGNHTGNPAAAALYSLGVGGLMFCRAGVQSQALKDGLLRADVDVVAFRDRKRIAWALAWYMTATVLLSWWTPWVIIAWFAVPVLAAVLVRVQGSGRS
jgi:TMEM175 potassium channel family protein